MKNRQIIVFPNVAAALGGAVNVQFTKRFAWVSLPGKANAVRLSRASLPPVEKWTAFNLADACQLEKRQ